MGAVEFLENIDDWETEEGFLITATMISSFKIINKCYEDIERDYIISIAPMLRQVQESIIVVFGLYYKVLTLKKYLSVKKVNYKKIMENIKLRTVGKEKEDFEKLDNLLQAFKKQLNDFSHNNFKGVMLLYGERHYSVDIKRLNRLMMKYFIKMFEAIFVVMTNHIFICSFNVPKGALTKSKLKEFSDLKYMTNRFPIKIREFFKNSDTLNDYYIKIYNDIKNNISNYSTENIETLFKDTQSTVG